MTRRLATRPTADQVFLMEPVKVIKLSTAVSFLT